MTKTGKRSSDRESELDILIGQNIIFCRKQKGMSQEDLAALLGVSFQQVQKYEKGTNRLSCSRLFSLCEALNCNYQNILPKKDKVFDKEFARMQKLYNVFIRKGIDIDTFIKSFGE